MNTKLTIYKDKIKKIFSKSDAVDKVYEKIKLLEKIMNKILSKMCEYNSDSAKKDDLVGVSAEILKELDIICSDDKCKNMIDLSNIEDIKKNVKKLQDHYNQNKNVNLICQHHITSSHYLKIDTSQIFKDIGGGGHTGNIFLNLQEILKENTNEYKDSAFLCVQVNNRIICSHNKPMQDNPCNYCEKWSENRKLFKQLIITMLANNDIISIINLMKLNLSLFPAAILEKDEYNYFYTSLAEYKKIKHLR